MFIGYHHKIPSINVKVTPKSLRIAEGSTARFKCSATSIVTHSLSWSRDGYRKLPLKATVSDGVLLIRNASREQSGRYTCAASNQISVDTVSVSLHIGGKCWLSFQLFHIFFLPDTMPWIKAAAKVAGCGKSHVRFAGDIFAYDLGPRYGCERCERKYKVRGLEVQLQSNIVTIVTIYYLSTKLFNLAQSRMSMILKYFEMTCIVY